MMATKPKNALQAGGMCHLWRSPDGWFKHTFIKLDFDCMRDNYPGVVIVADVNYENAFAAAVKSLQKELPSLLNQVQGEAVAYWWLEQDQSEITRILCSLTEHPVFADIR